MLDVFSLTADRAEQFAHWIDEAHNATGVPAEMIAALIATESAFQDHQSSSGGPVGPAQVIPRYWKSYCDGDLDEPGQNIICGAKALAHYRLSCEDWSCAFTKYNVGPAAYLRGDAKKRGERYLMKVLRNLAAFSQPEPPKLG